MIQWSVLTLTLPIGPLPPDEFGNAFIIVIIDRFSRWIELVPAKDATSVAAYRIRAVTLIHMRLT